MSQENGSKLISFDFMEKELNLLAFDLHDDVIQKLAIIKRNLEEGVSRNDGRTILSILYTHPILKLQLNDDGRGFDMNNLNGDGLGISSIKYRLELLNAQYKINSILDEGTELRFEIRISNE